VVLISIATLMAIGVVALAVWQFGKVKLVPVAEDTSVEKGFWKILQEKYYVDEIYDRIIVRPVYAISNVLLFKGVDRGLIDGLSVNGIGWRLPWAIGKLGSALQNGRVSTYAWVILLGAIAVLGAIIRL